MTIAKGQVQNYDVGCFGGRHFAYVASFGAFTRTSYATPQSIKNSLGHMAYLLEGISELSQIKTYHLRFETEETVIEDDFLFGAICNSTSVGGIITLDPNQVDMTDGLFEVLLVRYPKDLTEVAECIQALQNKTYNSKMMTFRSVRKISIAADPNMAWTLDGEKELGSSWIEIENLHRVLNLVR